MNARAPEHGFNLPPPTAPTMHGEATVHIVMAPTFGPNSTSLLCPTCHKSVHSKTVMKSNGRTHLIAILLCIFQCWLCIPCVYCCNTCRITRHYCPSCNAYLGEYSTI